MPHRLKNIATREYVTQPPEARPSQKCFLLQLSPELRNRIYHMCLPPEGPTHFSVNLTVYSWIKPLQICRMIRKEALPIFYGNIYFEARDRADYTGRVEQWLASVPLDTIFRRVRFVLPNYCKQCRRVRSTCASLTVEIDFRNTPAARVHMQCMMNQQHTDNEWRNIGEGEQREGLGSIVDRINSRKPCTGVFKQDWLDISEIFKQLEEEDRKAYQAALEASMAWYEAHVHGF